MQLIVCGISLLIALICSHNEGRGTKRGQKCTNITFCDIPLNNANHIAKPRVREEGGYKIT